MGQVRCRPLDDPHGGDVLLVAAPLRDAAALRVHKFPDALVLTIDQPRASRLVARAVDEGLLRREADQSDGRRTNLVLTAKGRKQLHRMHEFRQATFAAAMAEWSDEDSRSFARLLPISSAGTGKSPPWAGTGKDWPGRW